MDNEISNNYNNNKSNIEDVQDKVDKLVLTVFEAVIGHKSLILKNDNNNNPNKDLIDHHSNTIIQAYKDTLNSIDNLPGINKTKLQSL